MPQEFDPKALEEIRQIGARRRAAAVRAAELFNTLHATGESSDAVLNDIGMGRDEALELLADADPSPEVRAALEWLRERA